MGRTVFMLYLISLSGFTSAISNRSMDPLAFPLAWPWLTAFFTLTGFGYMMVHNSIHAEVAEIAPQLRASAFAMHSCSLFVGQAIGPIYFAAGMDTIGASNMLFVNAVVMLLIGPVISVLLSRLHRTHPA